MLLDKSGVLLHQAYILFDAIERSGKRKGKLPPCDRYRVVTLLDKRLTRSVDHLATWVAFSRLLDGAGDTGARDCAHFYFASTGVAAYIQGASFKVVRDKATRKPKAEPVAPVAPRHIPNRVE